MKFSLELIILLLFVYIFWLHYQLMKKNLFVNSIVERLSKLEKSWNKEYIDAESMIREDKILHENILSYLLGNSECRTFVHYTKEESTAKKIITEGFKFTESFHKTAEAISNDQIDLIYKHNVRKYFGKYVVVICLSEKLFALYENKLKKIKNVNLSVEQILTEEPSFMNENLEEIFICPKQFIKGYLNYESGVIVSNPGFNPEYDSPVFEQNLKKVERNSDNTK